MFNNIISKAKNFVTNHKGVAAGVGTTALTVVSSVPTLAAEGAATGYLESTVFSGISANLLADINTNILPNAWPIFGVILAVGVGMRLFKKVC